MLKPTPLAPMVLCRLFQNEMNLAEDQTLIRDQNFLLPNDKRLYISCGMMSAPVIISNVTDVFEKTVGTGDSATQQMFERNKVIQQEDIVIDCYSNGSEALFRNWEVVGALQSIYSQQLQEANYFKVFRMPRGLTNTSSAEGGSQINRFSIVVACHVWYQKEKPLTNAGGGDYFDDFKTRVDDEQTIGTNTPLIEFEIDQEGIVE